jgi:hypothetical protein
MSHKRSARRQLFTIDEPDSAASHTEKGDHKRHVPESASSGKKTSSKANANHEDSYRAALLQVKDTAPKTASAAAPNAADFPALPSPSTASSLNNPTSPTKKSTNKRRRQPSENLVLSSPISKEQRVIRRPSSPDSFSSSPSYSLWSGPASPFFSSGAPSLSSNQEPSLFYYDEYRPYPYNYYYYAPYPHASNIFVQTVI